MNKGKYGPKLFDRIQTDWFDRNIRVIPSKIINFFQGLY